MRTSEKISNTVVICFAFIMSMFGTVSSYNKFDNINNHIESSATAELALPSANTVSDFDKKPDTDTSPQPEQTSSSENESTAEIPFENTYLVTETTYRESNMKYNNFYVKNSTDLSLDLRGFLNAELPFEYEQTSQPQVLIVHTHSTEAYMDSDLGYYYESYDPSSTDDNKNIIRVGEAIVESLKNNGITAIHCTTHHDEPSYLGAYDNSAESIKEYLAQYPSIKIVLDIHRDSITTDENEKIKPTFVYNNKKAAQIMIMCGNDNYGYYDFPDWRQNMSLAVKLQATAESYYPEMTRPLYFGNFMYNMNLAPGSLLIEIGTDANTLDEAIYSAELLGNVIAHTLK